MKSTRRTDAELAAWHAAQAERYRTRITVRSDKTLAKIRRTIATLKGLAKGMGDSDVDVDSAEACLNCARSLQSALDFRTAMNAQRATPPLPFDSTDGASVVKEWRP